MLGVKKIIVKIDDFREEKIEDFIADKILAKIDSSKKLDDLEHAAIVTAITAANAYLSTYGVSIISEEVKDKIAKSSVKALGKANKKLQAQLKKKSKAYQKRLKECNNEII